jgi:O-antigen/teichoic acid export membrane protein
MALLTISPPARAALRGLGDLDATMAGALAVILAAQATFSINVESLRGMHHLGSASFLGLPTQRFISLLLALWLVYGVSDDLDVTQALWLTAIAAATALVVSGAVLFFRARGMPGRPPSRKDAKKMAVAGAPVLLTNVLGVTGNRLPVWVLAVIGELGEAGTFALAAAFVALIRLAHKTMIGTLSPFVATSYHSGERGALQSRIRVVAAATSVLAFLAGITLIVGGTTAVPRLFGSDFENAVPVASILLIGTLATTVAGPCGMVLNITGNERWMARAATVSVLASVAAIVPAAHLGGAIGAAIVMALGTVLRVGLQLRYARLHTGIFTAADFSALYRAARRGRS